LPRNRRVLTKRRMRIIFLTILDDLEELFPAKICK